LALGEIWSDLWKEGRKAKGKRQGRGEGMMDRVWRKMENGNGGKVKGWSVMFKIYG
jgi:hypothetical protein